MPNRCSINHCAFNKIIKPGCPVECSCGKTVTHELIQALDAAEEEEIPTEETEATIELLKAPHPKPKPRRKPRASREVTSEKPAQAQKRTRSSKSR